MGWRWKNGWWRDNAQKLLIIRNDRTTIPALRKLALNEQNFFERVFKNKTPAVARLHALWTLEGLNAINRELLLQAFKDEDFQVRKAAITISEPWLKGKNKQILTALSALKNDPVPDVRIQLVLSLRYCRTDKAKAVIKEIAASNATNDLLIKMATKSLVSDEYQSELKRITAGRNEFHKSLILNGADIYTQLCVTCHGAQGKGLPSGVAPPLAGSGRVKGDPQKLIRILLHGLTGPIDGKQYPADMPAMKDNSNEYLAAVISYIRTAMGNDASVVEPSEVRKVQQETIDRNMPWTAEALQRIKKIIYFQFLT